MARDRVEPIVRSRQLSLRVLNRFIENPRSRVSAKLRRSGSKADEFVQERADLTVRQPDARSGLCRAQIHWNRRLARLAACATEPLPDR